MVITVMRKVPFCAGHRLLHHEGKCANLHGHNYVVEFHVTGSEVDELGRVVDFAVINRLFKSWIDENWDHGFLLWEEDRDALQALRQVTPHKLYELPYNPTAENIARYLLLEVGPRLLQQVTGYELQLTRVVVWETVNASATAALNAEAQLFTTLDSAQEATE
ncbi:MAG: 6-pyruvoyl trahydropterin synthase family protein [Planctomycetota bacterium]|jgi:6-pyruvoyltetrahydropterin/6-carboxytetrahydropterin synthase|nr:6-carboxytetrahydropterin synthase [Blastopirellula sp.]